MLRYADNPNGSVDAIAGIANEAGNVVGLMPHPERASAALLGSADGLVLLRSLVGAASARPRPDGPHRGLTPAPHHSALHHPPRRPVGARATPSGRAP